MDPQRPPQEPPEEELRELLQVRERHIEGDRRTKGRRLSLILLGTVVVLLALFLSSGSNRQAVASLFKDAPPAPPPAPLDPAKLPLKGTGIEGEDVQLAKDILNFMNPPKAGPKQEAGH